MSARTVICFVWAFLSYLPGAQWAQASGAMWCSILVDGQEAFEGVIHRSGHEPEYEAVTGIGYADIRAVKNSPFQLVDGQDLDLKGNIEFSVRGFPNFRMQSLRIVYSPFIFKTTSGQIVESQWKIGAADISKINSFYRPIGDAMQKAEEKRQADELRGQQRNIDFVLIGAPILLCSVAALLCLGLFLRPRRVTKLAEK